MLASGQVEEAADIFSDILATLGNEPSFNLATTLVLLGRCLEAAGRPDLAEAQHRRGLDVVQKLEQSDQVKRLCATFYTELGDALADQGKFDDARRHYEESLTWKKDVRDLRGQGVTEGQLGNLAMRKGNLADAVQRHHEALRLFRQLKEPAVEAIAHNQLGNAYNRAGQSDQAEHHYRESARLKEELGDLAGAAQTWMNLAVTCQKSGKPEAAETWYRKAIEGGKRMGDMLPVSRAISNLAILLLDQPGRLAEARQLAEEALAINKTMDPGAAEIWKTYGILSQIADNALEPNEAAEYRRLARDAKRNFAGTAQETKQSAPVIAVVVGAVGGNEEAMAFAKQVVEQGQQAGGEAAEFVKSIERILAGERDADALCQNLVQYAPAVETILAALEDPTILDKMLPGDDDSQ